LNQENKLASRSSFLSALCILTFIGSTTGFIGYFLASVFFEQASRLIVTYSSWHSTDIISPFYFTVLMVLYALSLSGAIRMWKLHRDGFAIYSISQLIIAFLPVLWINWNAFSSVNALFTLVFAAGYAYNLRNMH
jgi:hypothetical protein